MIINSITTTFTHERVVMVGSCKIINYNIFNLLKRLGTGQTAEWCGFNLFSISGFSFTEHLEIAEQQEKQEAICKSFLPLPFSSQSLIQ